MDADDPIFTPREVELLQRPALRGYVVTAEHAARRYESLGVDKPWVVIPQGVNLSAATPELRAEAARRKAAGRGRARLDGRAAADRRRPRRRQPALQRRPPARALGARSTRACRTRGSGSSAARASGCASGWRPRRHRADRPAAARRGARDSGVLRRRALRAHGRPGHPRGEGLGVHRARRADRLLRLRGDLEPARDGRRRARARRRAFVDAVAHLLTDDGARGALADAAARAGRELDWDVLARRFEDEVLDRFLP